MNNGSPNKVVLITGASSGIGEEAVRRFSKMGHKVAGCARRVEKLKKLEQEVGENFLGVQADLTKEDDISNLFNQVHKKLGPIDILINNAGVGFETSIIDGDPSQWRQMLNLNVYALALTSHLALKDMLPKNHGHIFNISSISAHRVGLGAGMYAATKYGVRALTEGLRQELSQKKSKVRITAVSPGFVQTEFYNSYYHNLSEQEKSSVFDEMKALSPRDIVDAIIYSLETPAHVGVNDILIRPLEQLS